MRRAHLALNILDHRVVPATFGIPWPNGVAITVSFVPDGADVDGSANELYALMERCGINQAAWQKEIFRAFQSWTAPSDMNVGLVGDDGSSLGVPGYEQADCRFGDIRVFAAPLESSVLAITMPPGDVAGTRTGDILLNSNYTFGVGASAERDLYTVVLQEAGHALGVGNSPNTDSAMYEFYQGRRTELSAEDIGRIRALYGARPIRAWEPPAGNNLSSTATALAGTGDHVTYGDMASSSDCDWYSFPVAPYGPSGPTSIRLEVAGLSLLAGRIAIYATSQNELEYVGSATASGPGQDITKSVQLEPGETYFVRINEAPGTSFAAGQYRLRIDTPADGPEVLTLAGQAPVDDPGTNESFLSPTRLSNIASGSATEYRVFARMQPSDVDVYCVRSPWPGMNQSNVLTATVRAFSDIAPQVTVSNLLGLPVNSRVVADGNGLYAVVVEGVAANVDYHIAVSSQNGGAGDYELRAPFRSLVTSVHQVESDVLTFQSPTKTGTLDVTGSAQIYFRLTAALTPIIGPSITLRIYDSLNRVKFELLAMAGDRVDGVPLLGAGLYRVEVRANGLPVMPAVLAGFTLETALLTDPTGVPPSDPNNPGGDSGDQPPPPPPSGYNYYNDRGYYVWGETTPSSGG